MKREYWLTRLDDTMSACGDAEVLHGRSGVESTSVEYVGYSMRAMPCGKKMVLGHDIVTTRTHSTSPDDCNCVMFSQVIAAARV
jgi:hypothetical protein